MLNNHQYYDARGEINDPSEEVVREVSLLAKGNLLTIDVLLSTGGGNAKASMVRSKFSDGDLTKNQQRESNGVHHNVRRQCMHRFEYYRLEVDEGLQDVHVNEWNPASSGETTLQKIREATAIYLQKPEVRSQVEKCAESLVNKRAKRAKTWRWEYWATGTQYKCPKGNCRRPELRFSDRNLLLDHLRKRHNYPPPDVAHYQEVEALLDGGRTNEE